MKWTDEFGRWHDKPTVDDKPSSNNGYIYSAYASKLGLVDSILPIRDCFDESVVNIDHVKFTRHPPKWQSQGTPPPSRDEVIGLVSLGLLDVKYLKGNHWCYWIEGKSLDSLEWFNVVLEMLKIAGKDRNEVWTGNYRHAKQLAFRLNFHDIFYVKYMTGMDTTIEEEMLWSYYVEDMRTTDNWSAKNICILQMDDIGLDTSLMKIEESYVKYFNSEHPFLAKLQS